MARAYQTIRQFQNFLVELLYGYPQVPAEFYTQVLGPSGVDGKWGPYTRNAMNEVRRLFNLAPSELPDQALYDATLPVRMTMANQPPDLNQLLADIRAYQQEKQAEQRQELPKVETQEAPPLYYPPLTVEKKGIQWWHWLLIGVGGLAVATGIGIGIWYWKKKKKYAFLSDIEQPLQLISGYEDGLTGAKKVGEEDTESLSCPYSEPPRFSWGD